MPDIKSAIIWARDSEKSESAAQRLSQRLKIPVQASESVASATENADIIATLAYQQCLRHKAGTTFVT